VRAVSETTISATPIGRRLRKSISPETINRGIPQKYKRLLAVDQSENKFLLAPMHSRPARFLKLFLLSAPYDQYLNGPYIFRSSTGESFVSKQHSGTELHAVLSF